MVIQSNVVKLDDDAVRIKSTIETNKSLCKRKPVDDFVQFYTENYYHQVILWSYVEYQETEDEIMSDNCKDHYKQ